MTPVDEEESKSSQSENPAEVIESVLFKAKIIKQANNFNKAVYALTTKNINKLIESIFTRNGDFKKQQ